MSCSEQQLKQPLLESDEESRTDQEMSLLDSSEPVSNDDADVKRWGLKAHLRMSSVGHIIPQPTI